MKQCQQCSKEIPNSKKFCNSSCAASYNNKLRVRSDESKAKVAAAMRQYAKSHPDRIAEKVVKYKALVVERNKDLIKPTCEVCGVKITKANKYPYCRKHWFFSEQFQKTIGHNRNYEKGYVYNKWSNSSVYLLSSLEYKYYNYLEANEIEWIKPAPLTYILDGKSHLYFPDFYLPKTNEYIEVKGYMWEGDVEKLKAVTEQYPELTLKIIKKVDLKQLGY